jgi:hypothetical protein
MRKAEQRAQRLTRTVAVAVAVVAFVSAGCSSNETHQGTSNLPRPEAPDAPAGPGSPENPGTAPSGNFLTTPGAAQRVVDAIVRELGPRRVRYVNFYESYVIFEAQDPGTPDNIDRYTFRDGRLGPFEPVNVSGQTLADIEADLFAIGEVNWSAIPDLVRAALQQTALEGGSVALVSVERRLPFEPDVRIDVYVSGTRRNGWLEAAAGGTVLNVNVS